MHECQSVFPFRESNVIRVIVILVVLTLIVVPTALIVWRVVKALRPKPAPLSDNPEDFTHIHLDGRLSAVELMAAKNELREKQKLLTDRRELALVNKQIEEADRLLYDLDYPADDNRPFTPTKKVMQ